MPTKPTIIISPGGMHTPGHYEPLASVLRARGYTVVAVALPGNGAAAATAPPLASTAAVRAMIQEHVDKHHDVLVLGHSYGGWVASLAVKGLQKSARADGTGGVMRVVFLSALMTPEGMVLGTMLEHGGLPPWALFDPEANLIRPAPTCGELFYSDMPVEAQKYWAAQLENLTIKDSMETVHGAVWDVDVPKTFIYTTRDLANSSQQQEYMVKLAMEPRPQDWTFESIASDHSPFLSHTEEFAGILEKLAAEN